MLNNNLDIYESKYLLYKQKYINLKKELYGGVKKGPKVPIRPVHAIPENTLIFFIRSHAKMLPNFEPKNVEMGDYSMIKSIPGMSMIDDACPAIESRILGLLKSGKIITYDTLLDVYIKKYQKYDPFIGKLYKPGDTFTNVVILPDDDGDGISLNINQLTKDGSIDMFQDADFKSEYDKLIKVLKYNRNGDPTKSVTNNYILLSELLKLFSEKYKQHFILLVNVCSDTPGIGLKEIMEDWKAEFNAQYDADWKKWDEDLYKTSIFAKKYMINDIKDMFRLIFGSVGILWFRIIGCDKDNKLCRVIPKEHELSSIYIDIKKYIIGMKEHLKIADPLHDRKKKILSIMKKRLQKSKEDIIDKLREQHMKITMSPNVWRKLNERGLYDKYLKL